MTDWSFTRSTKRHEVTFQDWRNSPALSDTGVPPTPVDFLQFSSVSARNVWAQKEERAGQLRGETPLDRRLDIFIVTVMAADGAVPHLDTYKGQLSYAAQSAPNNNKFMWQWVFKWCVLSEWRDSLTCIHHSFTRFQYCDGGHFLQCRNLCWLSFLAPACSWVWPDRDKDGCLSVILTGCCVLTCLNYDCNKWLF